MNLGSAFMFVYKKSSHPLGLWFVLLIYLVQYPYTIAVVLYPQKPSGNAFMNPEQHES